MSRASKFEVPPEELRWTCDSRKFKFKSTSELEPVGDAVGQERALKALKLGLALFKPGYNIYVSGLTGSGKTSTVKNILDQMKPTLPLPPDRVYVNNFKDPNRPRLLSLTRGDGIKLKEGMDELIRFLLKNVPLIFEDENYQKRREEIMERYGGEEKHLFAEFGEKIKKENFTLAQVQMGPFTRPDLFPVYEGKAFPVEKIDEMVREGKIEASEGNRIRQRHGKFRTELEGLMEKSRDLARQMVTDLDDLARSIGRLAVNGFIRDLKARFDTADVKGYLDEVEESILNDLELFRSKGAGAESPVEKAKRKTETVDEFQDYRVNVILDNAQREGVPVIIETNPTYSNVFGTIEKTLDARGTWTTDFTKIKPGSLLMADGGYLVVNAYDLFNEPGVWKVLKRTLKNRMLVIQPPDVTFFFGQSSLKPDPIDLNFKLILIGDWRMYHLLYHYEPEFKKIFKVLADFTTEMDLTAPNLESYARLVAKVCKEEKLLHFAPSGVARLVEYGMWRAGRRGKLTALFSDIADIIRESGFWAGDDGADLVKARHVRKAIRAGIERHSLPEVRLLDVVQRGTIFIDLEGKVVGQVNGLSIYDLGNYKFGAPNRITASISTGRAGIVNIEREAKLSGKSHDKGVLVLSGYLRHKYARDRSLNLSASICFEQSYGPIEGDSASTAELYALLSALAEAPLDQSIAVTGSVNQKGDVQPVGGINAKVEGFFKLCSTAGLTGSQGVIIPRANIPDLMLKENVIEAVRKGSFHVWAIDSVDEGLEILTGAKAGQPSKKTGKYTRHSLNERIVNRLEELAENLRKENQSGLDGIPGNRAGKKKRARKAVAASKAGGRKTGKKKKGGKGN